MIGVKVRFTRHAEYESMPDEKISHEEVKETLRKSERTTKESKNKFKFLYRDLEVVARREKGCWLVITCYRIR